MLSRLNLLRYSNIRTFSTSSLLASIQNDSSVKNLDKVFSQVKENKIKDEAIYNTLVQKYSKLGEDIKCSEVLINATYNRIELSDEAVKAFEIVANKNSEPTKDDFAFVEEDYRKYKEALTRKN